MTAPRPVASCLAHRAVALDPDRRSSSSGAQVGQAEGVAVVAQVRAHPVADQGVQRRRRRARAAPGRSWPRSRAPRRRHGATATSAIRSNSAVGRRARASGARAPSRRGSRGDSRGPLGERAHTAAQGLAAHVEHPLHHGDQAGEGQQGEHDGEQDLGQRRARPARWPRARRPAGRPARRCRRWRSCRGPRRAPWRSDTTLPRIRQASARPAMSSWCPLAGVVQHQPAEDGGVAHPVEGGVEVGAPAAGAARHPGHHPVDGVGEDEDRDDERAPEELVPRG